MTGRSQRYLFDPVVVGHLECEAWASYYRRRWPRFLVYSIGMVDAAFGMRFDRSLVGAWHVLRANQFWAPRDNNPGAARESMRRFYELVGRAGRATFDPIRAAELEVEWWRLHRLHQYGELTSPDPLIDCLCALYGHVYDTDPESARKAASFRVQAMGISDRWVAHGRPREDPSMVQQRRALVDCYTELRRFIERLDEPPGGVTPE